MGIEPTTRTLQKSVATLEHGPPYFYYKVPQTGLEPASIHYATMDRLEGGGVTEACAEPRGDPSVLRVLGLIVKLTLGQCIYNRVTSLSFIHYLNTVA